MKKVIFILGLSLFSGSLYALEFNLNCEPTEDAVLREGTVVSLRTSSDGSNLVEITQIAQGSEPGPGLVQTEVITYKLSKVSLNREDGLVISGVDYSSDFFIGMRRAVTIALKKFTALHYEDEENQAEAKVTLFPPSNLVEPRLGIDTEMKCRVVVPR
jgi:hypothetical protein